MLLLAIMLNDIYATYSLDEGLEKMALSIVFALLLACRIIIHLQVVSIYISYYRHSFWPLCIRYSLQKYFLSVLLSLSDGRTECVI